MGIKSEVMAEWRILKLDAIFVRAADGNSMKITCFKCGCCWSWLTPECSVRVGIKSSWKSKLLFQPPRCAEERHRYISGDQVVVYADVKTRTIVSRRRPLLMKQTLFSGVNEGFVRTALLTLREHALSQRYATAAPFTRRGTLRTAHTPLNTGLQPSLGGKQPHTDASAWKWVWIWLHLVWTSTSGWFWWFQWKVDQILINWSTWSRRMIKKSGREMGNERVVGVSPAKGFSSGNHIQIRPT